MNNFKPVTVVFNTPYDVHLYRAAMERVANLVYGRYDLHYVTRDPLPDFAKKQLVLLEDVYVARVLNREQVKLTEPRVAEQYRLPVPPYAGFRLHAPR